MAAYTSSMSSANAAPEEEMVAMVAANNAAFFATVLLLFFETTFFAVFCFVFVVRWMMMKIKRMKKGRIQVIEELKMIKITTLKKVVARFTVD